MSVPQILSWRPLVLGLLALMLAGCQRAAAPIGPEAFPTRGQVVVKGKPASGVRIVLNPFPDVASPKFLPSAITDENGGFKVSTYSAGDGAPAGEYVLTLEWPVAKKADDDESIVVKDRLQGRYAVAAKSNWRVRIHEQDNILEPIKIP
ncbi:MAG TPA: hypothetical protein VHD36_09550 [Pirellulales bacterium]|nr:hypothetical protein [Pirellulales bacterium]